MNKCILPAFLVASCLAASASAQTAGSPPSPAPSPVQTTAAATPYAQSGAPAPLTVYFDIGSTKIRPQDKEVFDKASRAYNEGHPIVMILSAGADQTGSAELNLEISHERAMAVLKGLRDRGIPVERFQVLDKGVTDPAVPTNPGIAEAKDRRVDITWR